MPKEKQKGIVYWLLSEKDHRTYLGSSPDLEKRLKEHSEGKCFSTKNRLPLKLIYFEEYDSLEDARKREKFLKSRSGRRELKKIFEKLNKK